MTKRVPRSEARPPRRLAGALKPGAQGSGAVAFEIVRVFNATSVRYRVKCDQACNVDIIPLGADADPDATVLGNVGTQCTTKGKITNAIAANVESNVDLTQAAGDLGGEAYHLVKVTWGATPGNLNYIDVFQIVPTSAG